MYICVHVYNACKTTSQLIALQKRQHVACLGLWCILWGYSLSMPFLSTQWYTIYSHSATYVFKLSQHYRIFQTYYTCNGKDWNIYMTSDWPPPKSDGLQHRQLHASPIHPRCSLAFSTSLRRFSLRRRCPSARVVAPGYWHVKEAVRIWRWTAWRETPAPERFSRTWQVGPLQPESWGI